MHIGLIGGIGPAATDFYYRGLIDRHVASGIPLEVTIAHADVREMARNLVDGNPRRQAEIFAGLLERLKRAGAAAGAVTSMGGHFCIKELLAISPLPLVNAIPAVGTALARSGHKKVGLIGTRTVMESRLYSSITAPEVVVPEGEWLDRVHAAYSEMAQSGRVTDAHRTVFDTASHALCERGAEAIMLGGTDLFLAYAGRDPGFALVDCADIHVDAIYKESSSG
jgi:aspartate racemase